MKYLLTILVFLGCLSADARADFKCPSGEFLNQVNQL